MVFCAIATAAQAEPAATEGIGGTIMPLGSILDAKTDVGVAKMLKIKDTPSVTTTLVIKSKNDKPSLPNALTEKK